MERFYYATVYDKCYRITSHGSVEVPASSVIRKKLMDAYFFMLLMLLERDTKL